MVSTLVFSIGAAGLLLLILGERLGVPVNTGFVGLQALMALVCGLLILLSATNRLDPFLAEAPTSRGFGRLARACLLLFTAFAMSSGLTLDEPGRLVLLVAGYGAGTLLLLPREGGGAGGGIRRAALILLMIALIFLWFPPVLAMLAANLRFPPEPVRGLVIAALAIAVALGGATGLSRLSRALLLLGLAFALLPLGLAMMVETGLPREGMRIENWRGFALLLERGEAAFALGEIGRMEVWRRWLPDLLAGLAIGALGSAQRLPGEGAGQSLLIAALAPLLVAGAGLLVMAEILRLHGLVMVEIAGQPPARWPLFVFDEGIRGWMILCGEAPRDALDAIHACRPRGHATAFPASEIRLDPALTGRALAASRALPLVLGAGWMLAVPLAGLVALGLLLHGAASLASEGFMAWRRGAKALRSTRLLAARAAVLAPMAGLFLLPGEIWPEPRLALWLMLGTAGLIAMAHLADCLRAAMALWRGRALTLSAAAP